MYPGHCRLDGSFWSVQTFLMPTPAIDAFKGYRFPSEIISHAVWLYDRFSLSDLEDILAYRDIEVSHQTIHEGEQWFGPLSADVIRRKRPKLGDKWFLDETVIKMRGEFFYRWRSDQHAFSPSPPSSFQSQLSSRSKRRLRPLE